MTSPLLIAIVLVVLIYLVARSRRSNESVPPSAEVLKPGAPSENVYEGLRNTIFDGTREKFGLAPTSTAIEPWGVVMDWGIPHGTATVLALSDGSASIYLSGGGGYIGGQGQESIHRAAVKAVETAGEFQPQMRPTRDYVLPATGEVIFYVLTDDGVFTVTEQEVQLRDPAHPFAKLGNAMQNIVTQYRILEDFKK